MTPEKASKSADVNQWCIHLSSGYMAESPSILSSVERLQILPLATPLDEFLALAVLLELWTMVESQLRLANTLLDVVISQTPMRLLYRVRSPWLQNSMQESVYTPVYEAVS